MCLKHGKNAVALSAANVILEIKGPNYSLGLRIDCLLETRRRAQSQESHIEIHSKFSPLLF